MNAMNRSRFTVAGVAAIVLACAQPACSAGGAYFSSGHGSATTGVSRLPAVYARGECGHCHEAHASQDADSTLYRYNLFALEEAVCWKCHDGSVTYAADAKIPFSVTPTNTSTDYYKHPISDLYGGLTPSAHRAGESSPTAFGGASRHAECADCHNPHAARNDGTPGQSTHTPGGSGGNRISGALLAATGIVVNAWQAAGQPFTTASYSLQPLNSATTNYEWQICFKCHSTFATLPGYTVGSGDFLANKITSSATGQVQEYRDVGRAFNPNNPSFHPVTAQGRNTTIPAASFNGVWSTTSTMYCSDCHTKAVAASGATGPHGSANMHLLEMPFYLQENTHYTEPTWDEDIGHDPNEICFKCHRWETYVQKPGSPGADPVTNTNFRKGTNKNLHGMHIGKSKTAGATCYTCHDVHGTNSDHLINFNLATVTPGGGRNSISAYETTASGGRCYVTCHAKVHNPLSYSR